MEYGLLLFALFLCWLILRSVFRRGRRRDATRSLVTALGEVPGKYRGRRWEVGEWEK